MSPKCKILFGRGCRSTYGLSDPILRRLDEADWCDIMELHLIPADFRESYIKTDSYLNIEFEKINDKKPDLFLAMADRIEMCAAACAAFHNGIPIAHVYAGITNIPLSTLDDINRHCITLWSDIQFCEDEHSRKRVKALCWAIEKETNAHVVGITHLDDLEISEELVPNEPYTLVLINPTKEYEDLTEEYVLNDYEKNIIIGSNPDPKPMLKWDGNVRYRFDEVNTYDNLPRDQFLGLLKNCRRYITNSSSAYYEAPQWLSEDQIILIGERNKNRSTPKKLKTGASQKIVDILETYYKDNLNSIK